MADRIIKAILVALMFIVTVAIATVMLAFAALGSIPSDKGRDKGNGKFQ